MARFHPDDGIARYHPDDGASQGHLHLLCRGCLQVLDVPAASVHQAVQAAPWPRPVTGPTRSS